MLPAGLVILNLGPNDITFEHDHGVWNVTRAWCDCTRGEHMQYLFDVAEVLPGSAAIEFELAKVERYASEPGLAHFKPIFVVLQSKLWLIDGIHHIRAMHQLGLKQFTAFVIEEADTARYRVLFNGEYHMPKGRPS